MQSRKNWRRRAASGLLRPARRGLGIALRLVRAAQARLSGANDRLVQYIRRHFPELDPTAPLPTQAEAIAQYYASLAGPLAALRVRPTFSVLIPVYRIDPQILRETLLSVAAQVYPEWELCIVDDASGDPRIAALVEAWSRVRPGRVKFATNAANLHISATSNACLALATGEYVALLDHDDRLLPNALAEMARSIDAHGGPDILYSDERVIDERGEHRHGPFHKPGWSPLLHLSCNYTTHLSVYKRALLTRIGGFRRGYEGAQDHDLMLRAVEAATTPVVHVPFILYQWRAMPGSTALSTGEKPYAAAAGMKAVAEACARRGTPADVTWEPDTLHYRVSFALPAELPRVSVIIPTRDRLDLLQGCLDSLFAVTSYPNLEVVVVDNGSTCAKTLAYLAALAAARPEGVTIVRAPGPFNFGALNNLGAERAGGAYLLFLNNDTVILTPAWVHEMVRLAQLKQVGAVGAKLLYPDGTIQHAGILLTDRKVACHALRTLPERDHTYISMANTVHETSAVTAACLLVAGAKFRQAGGFDSHLLPNGFGDLDFCLKLRRLGYTNAYTPYAKLLHLESRSRGRSVEVFEKTVMLERWGHELMNDPYLNFNLARTEHYTLGDEACLDAAGQVLRRFWANSPAGVEFAGAEH